MLSLIQLIPPEKLWLFVTSGIVLNLTPGADVMFATAAGLRGGARPGAAAGLGVGLGALWHTLLAALGISALLTAWQGALVALRWAGAGYLLWLAWQSWRAGAGKVGTGGPLTTAEALHRSFLINAANPKVALFILAYLTQFADPARGAMWIQIVVLGAIFAATGTIITGLYGIIAGIFRQAMAARMTLLNRVASGMLVFLALRLVRN